ncbi:hypothetical protein MATL_G00215880 [Megalops atlanticus]|uniref:Fibronectin type-III domain-containing protein n=1 Tax=Megalops atlanticus TaxID=7932 RepID=A0A9D3SZL1_MEGAT|nr:hypothetical protein MATL_G00215880 [Megalops atlanticus]
MPEDSLHNNSASYLLEFKEDENENTKFDCHLEKTGDHYTCTTEAAIISPTFTDIDSFEVILYPYNAKPTLMNSEYCPMLHIKPNPPSNLTVRQVSRGYLFIWHSNYEHHPYISNELDYMFLYHKNGLLENGSPGLCMNQTLFIDDNMFEPDTEYTAKVCSIPRIPYQGVCSEWSPAVHWRTNVTQGPLGLDGFKPLGQVVCAVCVVAGVLLCLFFSPKARLRMKAWSEVPTPAPYFQPLYKNYSGNFQSWLVSQGSLREPFKMDELLKIDALIEAKPLKDEETFLTPTIHLMQCQPPYVGPGNKDWGADIFGSAPEDHPPTPVSLSALRTSFGEIFGSRSLDMGDGSEGDSGCEDLTHSLDISWPKGNLSMEPESVCFSEDYCTLSDSHNGLIPRAVLKPTWSKTSEGPCPEISPDADSSEMDVGAES